MTQKNDLSVDISSQQDVIDSIESFESRFFSNKLQDWTIIWKKDRLYLSDYLVEIEKRTYDSRGVLYNVYVSKGRKIISYEYWMDSLEKSILKVGELVWNEILYNSEKENEVYEINNVLESLKSSEVLEV